MDFILEWLGKCVSPSRHARATHILQHSYRPRIAQQRNCNTFTESLVKIRDKQTLLRLHNTEPGKISFLRTVFMFYNRSETHNRVNFKVLSTFRQTCNRKKTEKQSLQIWFECVTCKGKNRVKMSNQVDVTWARISR